MAMAETAGVRPPDARAKVRESMKLLLQGGPKKEPKELPKISSQVPVDKILVDNFGYSKFDQIGHEEEAAEAIDAAKRNEEFFQQLEKDYGQMCQQDGWDEVLRAAKEEPKVKERSFEEIPADSDYHRVSLPEGDRELRFDPERGRQLLAQLPQKPRRNLDALRKVEAETREAMEKERKRIAEMPKREPIRTSSDVVYLDTLDDSEDEPLKVSEPLRTKSDVVQLDSLSDTDEEADDPEVRRKQENALAALRAFEEFDRLGRERDAMLAKYRDKYGWALKM